MRAYLLTTRVSVRSSVCLPVCLSEDNFWKPWHRKFMCTSGISPGNTGQVRVWRSSGQGQSYRSKKIENPYSRNVKFQVAITPVLQNREPWGLHVAWDFLPWQIEWSDRHLCHVTGNYQVITKCTHSRVVGLRLEGSLVMAGISNEF